MKLVWTRLALADLNSAYNYITEENTPAAVRMIETIEKAVDALSRHPEIGRQGRVDGTRELIVPRTHFIVSYRIKDRRLEVLAVIHSARRWPDVI